VTMVVQITVTHVYEYPVEFVAKTHFSKYPNDKETFVEGIETIEKKTDKPNGRIYLRRIATCRNMVPSVLRKIGFLNESKIQLEELAWIDSKKREVKIQSRNLTWEHYAKLKESSVFKPYSDNVRWTTFEQTGSVEINGLGILGRLLETFAQGFLSQGTARALVIMEDLLHERAASDVGAHLPFGLTKSSWLS